jgi:hypothetical protein
VGDISAGLNSPEEVIGRLFAPTFECLGFWEPVKGGVELNGAEVFGVEIEPF